MGVLLEGARIVAGGVAGYVFARVAASYLENLHLAGALPVVGAAAVLIGTAMLASLMPAARAPRVDVLKASE